MRRLVMIGMVALLAPAAALAQVGASTGSAGASGSLSSSLGGTSLGATAGAAGALGTSPSTNGSSLTGTSTVGGRAALGSPGSGTVTGVPIAGLRSRSGVGLGATGGISSGAGTISTNGLAPVTTDQRDRAYGLGVGSGLSSNLSPGARAMMSSEPNTIGGSAGGVGSVAP